MNQLTTTTHTLQMRVLNSMFDNPEWGCWMTAFEGHYFDARRVASEGGVCAAIRLAEESFKGHNTNPRLQAEFRVESLTRTLTAHTLEEME